MRFSRMKSVILKKTAERQEINLGRPLKEFSEATNTVIKTTREDYIRVSDGELVTFDNISKVVYGQKNFWKCYLMDFLAVLGIIDNKQLDIFIYICENTNPTTNLFIGTYKKIAKDVGCSETTIAKIMKKLQDHNFIKRVQNGLWFVNPDLLMKGNDNKRQMLLSYYQSDEPVNKITYSRTKQKAITPGSENAITDIEEKTIEQGVALALPENEENND